MDLAIDVFDGRHSGGRRVTYSLLYPEVTPLTNLWPCRPSFIDTASLYYMRDLWLIPSIWPANAIVHFRLC